ncbi:MAG: DUF6624 domain-containing protein [Lutibacter sp.]|uniref:DUF6624 domain-containing protein n=1 Tax=Lutibacter sp. TaxID=1925666 RepID=UPI00299CFCF3|nr:DUF6624 domain-containing protein [Lutibacter sp.]MDX1828059.1 DUF6624 domain-containing protein [Lutibacter sp.]
MRKLLSVLILSFFANVCFSQSLTSKADSLRKEGKLEQAIAVYKQEYFKNSNNKDNTYNLACAYALAYQIDSAYHYLNVALKEDSRLWALADSDLFSLTNDSRWNEIENNQLEKFQKKNGMLKEPNYAKELLRIIMKDQVLDYYVKQARKSYMKNGFIPQWYYPLGAFKQQIGKDNYKKMQSLIEKFGWPKYSTVGKLAADAPLLVINHNESDAVRVKYLPQIKQSCLEGEGSCMEFAKIQDRILVNENKLQLYGMQFRYTKKRTLEPFPIKDPEYVDKRRKEIGLEPLKDYLKRKINYNWTVKQKK